MKIFWIVTICLFNLAFFGMLVYLFIQSYKTKAKKVIRSVDTWIRRKTREGTLESSRLNLPSMKRQSSTLEDINTATLENLKIEPISMDSPIRSPSSNRSLIGKQLREEEDISSIPNENDPSLNQIFSFEPLPKSMRMKTMKTPERK